MERLCCAFGGGKAEEDALAVTPRAAAGYAAINTAYPGIRRAARARGGGKGKHAGDASLAGLGRRRAGGRRAARAPRTARACDVGSSRRRRGSRRRAGAQTLFSSR
jgi:hypothetical protein